MRRAQSWPKRGGPQRAVALWWPPQVQLTALPGYLAVSRPHASSPSPSPASAPLAPDASAKP